MSVRSVLRAKTFCLCVCDLTLDVDPNLSLIQIHGINSGEAISDRIWCAVYAASRRQG